VSFEEFMKQADDAVYMGDVTLIEWDARRLFDQIRQLREELDRTKAALDRITGQRSTVDEVET
jgi:hypothetical protein